MRPREGPVVACECDHLTHFAILLSPGVKVCVCVFVCVCPLQCSYAQYMLTVIPGPQQSSDYPWLCPHSLFLAGAPADNVNLHYFQVLCVGTMGELSS